MGLGRIEIDRVIKWLKNHGHDNADIVEFFAFVATGQERTTEESDKKEDKQ